MKVKVDIHTPYWVTALRSDGKRTSLRTIRCPSELHDGAFGGRLLLDDGYQYDRREHGRSDRHIVCQRVSGERIVGRPETLAQRVQ